MFVQVKTDDGHVAPYEQLPCSAITPKRGMAMILSSGKLAIATGSAEPEFICVAEHERRRRERRRHGHGRARGPADRV